MKQTNSHKNKILSKITVVPALAIAAVVLAAAVIVPNARADQFDEQIRALQQLNSQAQGSLDGLQSQASSYQDAISKLQAQINALQQLINANINQQTQLQSQIDANKAELAKQKNFLATGIKTMYVDGQPSTIEMLASSDNLGDFVDKQEYRTAVNNKIQTTLKKIRDLQQQLDKQKTEIDQLLKDQRSQQANLDSSRSQQTQMLSYNESQQSAYNQQISSNQSKIGDLRKQQAILNAKYNIGNMKGDPGNGGYPSVWANAPQDSMIDSWGMYNRECVSYTAFRVHQDYLSGKNNRDMPYWGGVGNANQWDENARASGITVDNNPTPGSIAISNSGYFGHAMYVEAVSGNTIYVQQYNANLNGQYSEGWRYTTSLVFLHF
ncbi:MAG TPA: CHAP domain-containing protein [Patescibacteria group bacterium]|nr:CHAP domain-containing protein [Patescibacteria group bacterium]